MKSIIIIATLLSLASCGKGGSSSSGDIDYANCNTQYEVSVGGTPVANYDFGTLNPPFTTESRTTFSVKNVGSMACETGFRVGTTNFSFDPVLVVCGDNFVLNPGQSCSFDVVFNSTTGDGLITDELSIRDLDGVEFDSISITGTINR